MTSDAIPTKDRVAVTREIFGRQFMRVEVEELTDAPIRVDLKMRAFPGLHLIKGVVHNTKATRIGPQMSDGVDDIFLTINLTGTYNVIQRRHDVVLNPGDAGITGCGIPSTYRRPGGNALGLRMPRAALATRVAHIDDHLGARLARGTRALGLLQNYTDVLQDVRDSPELTQLSVSHIYDLVALCLGPKPGSDADSQRNSLNAARLHAIKTYITTNLAHPELGIGEIAAWQHLTPRQVQRLFERDGTTFSAFLSTRRLELAYRAFADPGRAQQNISQIVFDCGFGDVSNFNHAFRRHYGATPSEVRNRGAFNIAHLAAT